MQVKAIEQYFPVVLFIMLYKVFLAFKPVDEIPHWSEELIHSCYPLPSVKKVNFTNVTRFCTTTRL